MGIFSAFYPDYRIASVYTTDYERLYREGCRGVIFDIDNTLVLHDQPATEEAVELFRKIHGAGLKSCLLSNNDEPRVKAFAETAGIDRYIFKAGKPLPESYRRAAELLGTDAQHVIFFGDQLFTDIWGARNAGVTAVLVQPVGPEKLLKIRLKRLLEKPVLWCYSRKHPRLDRL